MSDVGFKFLCALF